MTQIHKRYIADQLKVLFNSYEKGHITREEIERTLGIGKTRFFALLKQYKNEPDSFSIAYERRSTARLDEGIEDRIKLELQRDKQLIEDDDLPIYNYNYAALNDRLKKDGIRVSTTTIIKRAKEQHCYKAKKRSKDRHDREVITFATGDLIQHDASIHKWSPFATEKWTLITSIDDYSRMLLYADLVESETSWAHIQAAQSLIQNFGIPHQYYVDNLRVFRFIQHRDSVWKKLILGTDDIKTQWGKIMDLLNINVLFALSPQAKGKVERPYQWMQDRIVRTCALDHVSDITNVRSILNEEIHRYNYLQVHSTTKEIPVIRFEKALKHNNSLFRVFVLPKPYKSSKDVFCITHNRIADGYCNVSFAGHSFHIPGIEPREDVELHFVPDSAKNFVEIRFWAHSSLVHSINLPISEISKTVHF